MIADVVADAIFETRWRALVGFPLFLIAVWLIYYCDKNIKESSDWRGWLLWPLAFGCMGASFVLLLFRDSLWKIGG